MTTLKELIEARRMKMAEGQALPRHIPLSQPTTITALPTPSPIEEKKKSLKELLSEKLHKNENGLPLPIPTVNAEDVTTKLASYEKTPIEQNSKTYEGAFALDIILNEKQLLAKELAFSGKSFCLVGAAGTGKTTAQREIAAALIKQDLLGTHTFRIQGTKDFVVAPSIAFVAYTRIASGNLKKAIHKDTTLASLLQHNITTIHNLLEYTPEFFTTEEGKASMRFVPKRNRSNKLDITHLIIEESSMVGLDLWEKLFDALRENVQIIFIGDINQLPPVFGASILNYGLVQLPVVSLTEVYRQSEASLVLKNAHNILKGEAIEIGEDFRVIEGGTIQHHQSSMAPMLGKQFPIWQDKGIYDPEQDIILSPWNKKDLGTINMNNWIAQYLGKKRNAVVYEILAGMNKLYLAVGDKVLYNKQVGEVVKISKNMSYKGKPPQKEGSELTRFGVRIGNSTKEDSIGDSEAGDEEDMFAGYEDIDLDKLLEKEEGTPKGCASHLVDVLLETGEVHTLETIGDFSPSAFSLGYCLTVHKAQGCEWRRVFIIFHRDHRVSLCRELFYTAVTRAREQVYIIGKHTTITQAIKTQRIKGNTIEEKIQWFNSGLMEAGKTVNIIK